MTREEIEQYIEENGTPIERMERKLRAMERDSMKRWMTVAVVAAFLAMIMAGVAIAQSRTPHGVRGLKFPRRPISSSGAAVAPRTGCVD